MKNIVKILTALAAIAGAVYIIATYGEQIVAWAKKLLNAMPKCPACEETEVVEAVVEEPVAEAPEAAEDAEAQEVPAQEVPVEEPAPQVAVAENEPVAAEEDFAE